MNWASLLELFHKHHVGWKGSLPGDTFHCPQKKEKEVTRQGMRHPSVVSDLWQKSHWAVPRQPSLTSGSGVFRLAQTFKTLHYSAKPPSFLKWTKNELGVLVTSVEESNGWNKIVRSTRVIFIMGLKDTHIISSTGLTDCLLRSSQYLLMDPTSQTHGGTEYNRPSCVAGT